MDISYYIRRMTSQIGKRRRSKEERKMCMYKTENAKTAMLWWPGTGTNSSS